MARHSLKKENVKNKRNRKNKVIAISCIVILLLVVLVFFQVKNIYSMNNDKELEKLQKNIKENEALQKKLSNYITEGTSEENINEEYRVVLRELGIADE